MKKLLLVLNVLFIFLFISCSPERQDARIETWVIDEQEEPKNKLLKWRNPSLYCKNESSWRYYDA